jgi:hypothetical protein
VRPDIFIQRGLSFGARCQCFERFPSLPTVQQPLYLGPGGRLRFRIFTLRRRPTFDAHLSLSFVACVPLAAVLAAQFHHGKLSHGPFPALMAIVLVVQFLVSPETFATAPLLGAISFAIICCSWRLMCESHCGRSQHTWRSLISSSQTLSPILYIMFSRPENILIDNVSYASTVKDLFIPSPLMLISHHRYLLMMGLKKQNPFDYVIVSIRLLLRPCSSVSGVLRARMLAQRARQSPDLSARSFFGCLPAVISECGLRPTSTSLVFHREDTSDEICIAHQDRSIFLSGARNHSSYVARYGSTRLVSHYSRCAGNRYPSA